MIARNPYDQEIVVRSTILAKSVFIIKNAEKNTARPAVFEAILYKDLFSL